MADAPRCGRCGRPEPVVGLSRDLAGLAQDIELCAACAAELGVRPGKGRLPPTVGDLCEVLIDPAGAAAADKRACPRCGTTFAALRATGLAGCVHCFDHFRAGIAGLLPRIARRTVHAGSVPRRLRAIRRLFADRGDLRSRLEAALSAEHYERAAELRDALRELEGED